MIISVDSAPLHSACRRGGTLMRAAQRRKSCTPFGPLGVLSASLDIESSSTSTHQLSTASDWGGCWAIVSASARLRRRVRPSPFDSLIHCKQRSLRRKSRLCSCSHNALRNAVASGAEARSGR